MNFNISKVKIVVAAPAKNADEIRKVLGDFGAGVIGNYSHCSMSTICMGAFKAGDASNPYIGAKNKLEKVKEIKIEVQCDIKKAEFVIKKLREVHPYEEPCIEIFPLINEIDLPH